MKGDPRISSWVKLHAFRPEICRELRRRAVFECCKWDPQIEDVETLAPMAMVLRASAWRELQQVAETLAEETIALENAILRRPDLWRNLGIPNPIRKALAARIDCHANPASHVRVMRFDFHPTVEGWRVSEVNTDVPGGYNEASGLTSLAAEHVVGAIPVADPSEALVDSIAAVTPPGATVGLVHATAYSDDRQVMVFLARRLQRRGLRAVLLAPDHIQWGNGQAIIRTDWFVGRADFVFRFFPAEWLPNLGRQCDWASFLLNSQTPLCNPASALLTQSKRWPLVRNTLGLPLPTWTRYLPESRDPREVDWQSDPDWVVKPALGRVGDSIGLHGVTTEREWKTIRRSLRWNAGDWIIQRRFVPVPFVVDGRDWHACLGVYTINGRAAGIYGRVAPQPLINHLAREVAVLVEHAPTSTALDAPECYEPHRTL